MHRKAWHALIVTLHSRSLFLSLWHVGFLGAATDDQDLMLALSQHPVSCLTLVRVVVVLLVTEWKRNAKDAIDTMLFTCLKEAQDDSNRHASFEHTHTFRFRCQGQCGS